MQLGPTVITTQKTIHDYNMDYSPTPYIGINNIWT
jgi:hypothetical protein